MFVKGVLALIPFVWGGNFLTGCFPLASALATHDSHPRVEIANPCLPTGAQRIAVILATYDGAPLTTAIPNADYVRELFLGATHDFSVSDYYQTVSGKHTWFESVTVLGPYHSLHPFVVNSLQNAGVDRGLEKWETDLVAMAKSDLDFSQIDRVVFITPNAVNEMGGAVPMGAGLAGQGVCDIDSVNLHGVHHPLAHAWILARPEYQGINLQQITGGTAMGSAQLEKAIRRQNMLDMAPIAHELGHTFGLGHANQVYRPQIGHSTPFMNDEILPAANQTLYQITYADPFSVMSANEIQWLNIAHLTKLGWLAKNQVQEVRLAGVYRIYPLETADGNRKGLKIPRVIQSPNESTASNLWVEYRQKNGVYDTDLSGVNHRLAGAIVHYTNPKQPGPNSIWPEETVLLNFHPAGQPVNPYETDLTLTQKWKDDHSLVSLAVVSITPEYLDIEVEFNPRP